MAREIATRARKYNRFEFGLFPPHQISGAIAAHVADGDAGHDGGGAGSLHECSTDIRMNEGGCEPGGGHPDDLTVDAEGCVWVAVPNAGCVLRYRPDGTLDGRVDVPGVTWAIACGFGGENLDRLFITTSKRDVDQKEEPLAGSLFAVDPGVRGLPAREFAG